ncbi:MULTISPECIES: hypothetical protein [Aerococcus]|uniref:Glycerol acyltransferase n=1 Tax=Aerococcus urinae TaxID=1376 RepID=A0A2I1L633_9LACT|nr:MULTISPECIES: hypothetical protein [Aerococcus]KAA9266615.1 glycerol acyltransferase [Aerococcus loyolae]MCY3067727.1 hypothetical protein [Aerococcus mictus]MCY3080372.1 hypothetical protein [Aerococcus mictus]MDK6231444.1 hypothetical protein [Aerococcus urinae]MDK6258024.1 hypothetical protein [Aerococcus urinae]
MEREFGPVLGFCRRIVRLFIPTYRIDQDASVDLNQPTVFVSHHENLRGPLKIIIWTTIFMRIWVLAKLTEPKACYQHFVDYTFTQRFHLPKAIAKLLAFPAAWIASFFLNQARVIPVYRGSRQLKKTFTCSLQALEERIPVTIFPDVDYQSKDQPVGKIYEGFLHLEKLYYRKYQEHIQFVPLYANRKTHKIYCGQAVTFQGSKENFRQERDHVAQELQDQLNRLIDKD